MVRSSPRSVPPVDQCPTEIFRSCRALSRRLAALSCTAVTAGARKAPGSAPFSRSRPMMQKYRNINRSVWLRRQSRANPSLRSDSLIHGKIQGISRFQACFGPSGEPNTPEIPPVLSANSLSRRTGNFRAAAGKIGDRSGNFLAASGKRRLWPEFRANRPQCPAWKNTSAASHPERDRVATSLALRGLTLGNPGLAADDLVPQRSLLLPSSIDATTESQYQAHPTYDSWRT
jgi:hypothetical protein